MSTPRLLPALAAAGLALASFAASAAGSSCDPVVAASTRLLTVPSHQTMTFERGGKTAVFMEAVVIDKVKWTRPGADGKWEKEPTTPGNGIESLKKADCHLVRDDSADGEAAAVYEVRHLDGDADSHPEEVWISKANGLLLRILAMDKGGKVRAMTRFDYKGVKAP